MKKGFMKDSAYGVSPLGGNSVEGTSTANAPVRDSAVQAVPLTYDRRAGAFVSEQAIDELDDRDASLAQAKINERNEAWKAKAGFHQAHNERT